MRVDECFQDESPGFCLGFLASTTTDYVAIHTDYANCENNIAAASSAWSCITYTYTQTALTLSFSSSPVETSSSYPGITPQSTGSSYSINSISSITTTTTEYTTSIIYSATIYTVTSCTSTVPNCPLPPPTSTPYSTTEIIPVTTTVCPVSSSKPSTHPSPPYPFTSISIFYSTKAYTITACAALSSCAVGQVITTVIPTGTTCITLGSTLGPVASFTYSASYGATVTYQQTTAAATTAYGTGVVPSKTTGTQIVSAAAEKVGRRLEMAAGVVGVLAVAIL
ncbi:uncharacterized protein BCR38DRAFT_488484 [Pseudomassariella vexata]|uniref:Extracellular membrane protein CFEM domain-containing protein n=1 Tax=Pseudomassariella vexata TaxID=1141098 RepID=A0A1Y2DJU1_9PEZI|nr:uncharacterized protein BCR38DRAFT_488484 [Pseudomassariella vexata]ORY59459.1 hypothetical protein BCR38DRAFT_488484 [Pseudomassariella vexata]